MVKKESPFLLDKAKFKSRRGLNELDQILVPFVTEKFQQLDEIDKILFLELLEFEDVDEDDIYGDYDSETVSSDIETDVVVEVEKDTLQLLLDAFKVTN